MVVTEGTHKEDFLIMSTSMWSLLFLYENTVEHFMWDPTLFPLKVLSCYLISWYKQQDRLLGLTQADNMPYASVTGSVIKRIEVLACTIGGQSFN